MCSSWDRRHDKQSFLSFWVIFCPLTFLTTREIRILKKWKKCLKILSFYTCIPQMMIIWCMVPEIWSATDRIFSHFVQKWNLYDVCFLRCGAQKTYFFLILDHFLPFYSLTTQKIKKKMKKMLVDIIILHKCTINDNHIIYDS